MSEQTEIHWMITSTSHECLQLGNIFYLYVEGSYLDTQGKMRTVFLFTQLNHFCEKYTSITIGTFDWRKQAMSYGTYLIPSELIDISTQIQPYATYVLLANPTYDFNEKEINYCQ